MRVSRILGLLAAITLSLTFVIPAADLPETPQDESDKLLYEAPPGFGGERIEDSALDLTVITLARRNARPAPRKVAAWAELPGHPSAYSLTVVDPPLRC